MKVLALRTHDSNDLQSRNRGDVYECPKHEADLLIKNGIVREKKAVKKKDTKSTTEKISKSTRKKTKAKKIKTK